MTLFVLLTIWDWYDNYGWHVPTRGDWYVDILVGLVSSCIAGYLYGKWVWISLGPPEQSTSTE